MFIYAEEAPMTIDALDGYTVVELTSGVAGAYATKLFADAGADVIVIEPADGSALRRTTRSGPLPEGDPDGPLWRWLAAGKRCVTGDLTDPTVRRLAHSAHVVVADLPTGPLEEAGLLPRPGNVVVTISPYGRGPLEDAPGNDFTAQAICGSIGGRGRPDAEPLYAAGRLSELAGGVFAAPAALAAARKLLRTGVGAHIDVSCAEAALIATNLFQDLMYRMIGGVPPGPGRMIMFPGIEATSDGWVGLNTNSAQKLEDLIVLVGRADLLGDTDVRSDPVRKAESERSIKSWLQEHTTAEVLELATERRIPVAPIGNGKMLPGLDHFVARGVFVNEPYTLTAPRPHYAIDGRRPGARHPAPTRAERTPPVAPMDDAPRTDTDAPDADDLPLAGLKILDATAWWAGPSSTHLLAALGADVVHVESIQVIDGMRPAAALPFASLPEWWERSCFFLNINTNKRGITLDLGSAPGRELFLGLVAWADVMVENYTPRVIEQWDLGWERLKQVNPRLVMCRMPAFGLDGPWRDRVGFAQTMEQVSGLSWTTGYRDGPPLMPNGPCDPLGGMHAAFAILTALQQRDITGAGCMIEAPLVESALNLAAEEVLEFSAFGRVGERLGNRCRERAPQGVYRCDGDERWIAVSVQDEQWPALVDLLGAPEWAQDPALSTVAGRFDAHDRLDQHLADWFGTLERDDAVERLRAAGVAAAPVVDSRNVVTEPVFEARGFAEWCDHPVVGHIPVTTLPFRWSGIDRWIRCPAPTLGQHNHEVLSSILGLDEAEIERLEAQHVIGTRPAGQ
jgi:crotonobetainyl-CoA:carnitine CoA-transferase CaiB-like acyl-CoA transferase